MNPQVKNICEIVEDIKENITDSQYKGIMDSLMVLNKNEEESEDEEPSEEEIVHNELLLHLTNLHRAQNLRMNDKMNINKRLYDTYNEVLNILRTY